MRVDGIFLIHHANLLFPNICCRFFELEVKFLKVISVCCGPSRPRVTRVDPFEAIIGQVLINQIVVEPDSLVVFFNTHSLNVSILHGHFLFLF